MDWEDRLDDWELELELGARLDGSDWVTLEKAAANITCPFLVVHGENDSVVPMAFGKLLYGLIRAPKRFVSVAGGGHSDLGARALSAAKKFIAEKRQTIA